MNRVRVCPYCGHNNEGEKVCTYCNKKLDWLEILEKKSEVYYAKAYIYATKRELSKAEEMLKQAILLNTYHIPSKNLLGLIYLEMGDIAQALKMWILSTSIQKEGNIANDYLTTIQEDTRKLEKYKLATSLYNQALRYLKQKNEDVAMIRLKKAIALNENFIEAKNLLAICYLYQKQYHKALEQIDDVLQMDTSNEKALYYAYLAKKQEEIGSKNEVRSLIEAPHLKDIRPNAGEYKSQKMGGSANRLFNATLCFLLGGLCTFAIVFGLILPEKTRELEAKIVYVEEEKSKVEERLTTTEDEMEKKIKGLTEDIASITEENKALQEEKNSIEQKSKLFEGINLATQNNWVQSADVLYNVLATELSPEQLQTYEQTKKNVFERAANTLYNEGYTYYLRKEKVEAMAKFEKVVLYMPGSWVASQALYYMGEMQETENVEKAKQYYTMLLDEYVGTNAAVKAKNRMNGL